MTDVHNPKTRRRNMQAIQATNTRPEWLLRRLLHRQGIRYRIAPEGVVGRPDLWLAKWNAAIFIHGCFWHVHECDRFRWPATRKEFWKRKLSANKKRDAAICRKLLGQGVRVLLVWECALMGKGSVDPQLIVTLVRSWLLSGKQYGEIDQTGLCLHPASLESAEK